MSNAAPDIITTLWLYILFSIYIHFSFDKNFKIKKIELRYLTQMVRKNPNMILSRISFCQILFTSQSNIELSESPSSKNQMINKNN
jgi:hypothetical protein